METEIISAISTIGFPAFVAVYFMFKTEKAIKNNTEALTNIKITMENCRKK